MSLLIRKLPTKTYYFFLLKNKCTSLGSGWNKVIANSSCNQSEPWRGAGRPSLRIIGEHGDATHWRNNKSQPLEWFNSLYSECRHPLVSLINEFTSRGGTRGWLHGEEDHPGLTMMTRHKMAGQRAVFPGDYNRNLFPLFGKRIIYAIFWLYEVVLFTLF